MLRRASRCSTRPTRTSCSNSSSRRAAGGRGRAGQRARTRLGNGHVAAADQTFRDMLGEAIRERDTLMRWIEAAGGVEGDRAAFAGARHRGRRQRRAGRDRNCRRRLICRVRMGGGRRDLRGEFERTTRSRRALPSAGGARLRSLDAYLRYFLHQRRDKSAKSIVTAALKKTDPSLCRGWPTNNRVCNLLLRKRAHRGARPHSALITIAAGDRALPRRKGSPRPARLRRPDRQDARLCSTTSSAAWVHYKLDRGIDHVLIDEAQDTSPKQWEIIKALVGEFFAGAGARDAAAHDLRGRRREAIDLLVPGRRAARIRRHAALFRARCTSSRARFRLDRVQALIPLGRERARCGRHRVQAPSGPRGFDRVAEGDRRMRRCRQAAPGLVEIWPLITPDERKRDRGLGCAVRHVRRRAQRCGSSRGASPSTSRSGEAHGGRPGDVLVLVRRRGALFEAIIRALKNARHPGGGRRPAGADRAYRGDGPDCARRRAAAAGRRSRARDRAQEPAVRARRRATVRARMGPQGHPARALRDAEARSRGAARRAARTPRAA